MKKHIILRICLLLLLLALAGCSPNKNDSITSFGAVVLEVDNSSLLVEPAEGSKELLSSDKIIVYIKDAVLEYEGDPIIVEDIKTGAEVEIFYDGAIAESYPAQISGCKKINLVKSGD